MKTLSKGLLAAALAATPVYAAPSEPGGHGMLMTMFFGFAALVIAFQLVPALMLFFAMVKGLCSALASPAVQEGHGKKL